MTFRINGRKVCISTKTNNKKRAERIHAKRATEIAEGRWFPNEARRRTFEELKERYMKEHSSVHKARTSYERDVQSFKRLSAFFGGMTLADITPVRISDYKALRQDDGVKTGTIAKELELLRNALNFAVREWEWLELNPFLKVKIEKAKNGIERWITSEEEQRLLDASPSWLRQIITFALNTGMREGEILYLQWPQVDLSRRTVALLQTKNKEKRTIPLNQTVLDLLKAMNRVRHISGYVFASAGGTMIGRRNLLRAFFIARKKAGLEDVRFHDLRHTFATRLVQARTPLYDVKELLGHKTLTMTMRYAHHNPESLRHAVEVLDGGGYDLVTLDKKRELAMSAIPSKIHGMKRKNMVGDAGFEPATPAV